MLSIGDTVKVVKRSGIRTSGFTGEIIDLKDNYYGRDKLVRVRFNKIGDKDHSTNWYLSCNLILVKSVSTFDFKKDDNTKFIDLNNTKTNNTIFRVPEGYTVKVISKDYGDFGKEYPLVYEAINSIKEKLISIGGINSNTVQLEDYLEILEKIYHDWLAQQQTIFSIEKEEI